MLGTLTTNPMPLHLPTAHPPPARPGASRIVASLAVALATLLVVAGTSPSVSSASPQPGPAVATIVAPGQLDEEPPGTDPAAPGDDPDPDEPTPRTGPEEDIETDPADEPETDPSDEPDEPDTPTTVFPPGPPPGFTEEQFRRFVDVVVVCGFDAGWVCDSVFALTGNETLAETAQWIYDIPLRLAIILLLAFGANRLVRRGVGRYAGKVSARSAAERDADPDTIKRDELRVTTATNAIGGAATVVIVVIAGLISLGELGITLGPLLAGAGIAGVALGFGAQNMVRDVLAGIFVVFEDHYGVGDIIDAGRASGIVEDVSLRITKVRDIEGTLWFIPNGIIEGVGNRTQLWARAIIDFDIDYRADHERAGEIIKATADWIWQDDDAPVRILEEPALWGVESLGDSSVVIRLAVKCAPAEQWSLARMLRSEVKKALDAEGIEIPFPQHTVWVHGVPEGDVQAAGAAGAVGTIEATDSVR